MAVLLLLLLLLLLPLLLVGQMALSRRSLSCSYTKGYRWMASQLGTRLCGVAWASGKEERTY